MSGRIRKGHKFGLTDRIDRVNREGGSGENESDPNGPTTKFMKWEEIIVNIADFFVPRWNYWRG